MAEHPHTSRSIYRDTYTCKGIPIGMHIIEGVDYEKLRQILQKQFGRDVSIDEAVRTGKHLLKIYEILLDNGGNNGKISVDTANR